MTEAKLGMALDDIIMRDSEQRRGGKDRRRREPERRNPYSRVKDEDDGYRSTLQRRNHNRRRYSAWICAFLDLAVLLQAKWKLQVRDLGFRYQFKACW